MDEENVLIQTSVVLVFSWPITECGDLLFRNLIDLFLISYFYHSVPCFGNSIPTTHLLKHVYLCLMGGNLEWRGNYYSLSLCGQFLGPRLRRLSQYLRTGHLVNSTPQPGSLLQCILRDFCARHYSHLIVSCFLSCFSLKAIKTFSLFTLLLWSTRE